MIQVGESALSQWHLRNTSSLRGCINNFFIDEKAIDFLQVFRDSSSTTHQTVEVILSSHFSTKNFVPLQAAHRKPGVLAGCYQRLPRVIATIITIAITIFIAILDEKSMTPMARYLSSSVALADSQPRTSHEAEHGPAQHLEARGEEAGAEGRGLPPQREVGVEGHDQGIHRSRNPGRGWGGRRGNCEAHRCRLNIFHKAF